MTLDESNAPARVLKRAEAIGVNAACRGAGISQTLFYRWRLAFSGTDPMACTRGLGVPPRVSRIGLVLTLAPSQNAACDYCAAATAPWKIVAGVRPRTR